MADNPYVNKVEYSGQTLMDLTGDTVTPSDVMNGVTFHDRSGALQQGNLITHNVYDGLDSDSSSDALSAKQGKILNDILLNVSDSSDLNAITKTGYYYAKDTTSNRPADWCIVHHITESNNIATQLAQCVITNRLFFRRKITGTWGSWEEVYLKKDIENNSVTGSDAITTSHTITSARVSRLGHLVVATVSIRLTSNVSAWNAIFKINNVELDASTYVFSDVGNVTKELYVGTDGVVSGVTSLNSGSEIKVTIPLAVK